MLGRVNRKVLIAVLTTVVVVGGALLVWATGSDSQRSADRQRYAVRWDAIEVSADRRTVTVVTSYPLDGFCVKEPDGVEISLDGRLATVAAWMTGPPRGSDIMCTLECFQVTQTVTLDSPLPEPVEFEPVPHAVEGCS